MPAPPVQPMDAPAWPCWSRRDRKSTRLNSSHTVIYTLSLHDALPILTLIGASMLWVGWFGFNAGSAGAADGRAGMAMLVTQMATAAAALAWMSAEWVSRGKPSVLGIASGAVAGLVAITPASGFVGPTSAVIIGLIAGVVCFIAATSVKRALGYDDSLDAFGVHCIGGIVGALLTGAFASKEISGVDGSVLTQLKGVTLTLVYG